MFLAYDHGLEHGPTDFTDANIDPSKILDIAVKGKYDGIILQRGIAEKYFNHKIHRTNLIIKLNGKTNLVKDEPYSAPLCAVDEAIKLGAGAVGYTVYVGSTFEAQMFKEFSRVIEEAHRRDLPVVAWMYPRGASVKGKEKSKEILAYAARVGLELGADMLKMHYAGSIEDMRWVVKSAGKSRIIISGGEKLDEKEFISDLRDSLKSGCCGIAVGRNVWQSKDPLDITYKIKLCLT